MSQTVGTAYVPPKNYVSIFNPAEFERDTTAFNQSVSSTEQFIISSNDAQTKQIADNSTEYDTIFPVNPSLYTNDLTYNSNAPTNTWINILTVPSIVKTNILGNISGSCYCPSGITCLIIRIYDPTITPYLAYLYIYPNFNGSTTNTIVSFNKVYVYKATGNDISYDVYIQSPATSTAILFPSPFSGLPPAINNTFSTPLITQLSITYTNNIE
jgi:hypothetical protein